MPRRLPVAPPSVVMLLGLLGALTVSVLPAAAAPVTRMPGTSIEVMSPYQAQSTCNPTPKPGTVALSKLVMAAYPGTGTSGIARDCSIGGLSEHKEGRAWDWHVVYSNPAQRAQAADFLHWLFATDAYGNTFAQARRLGIMYVIWNKRIWGSYSAGAGWRPYTGSDPHTGHMHISLSWAGAEKKTSYWTGAVAPVLRAPGAPVKPVKPVTPVAAAPIEAPAKDLFPTTDPDRNAPVGSHDSASPTPTVPRTIDNPDHLPVLALGEGGVDVQAADDGLSTPFLLLGGKDYLLTVTGTYAYGPDPMQADAECSRWPRDRNWHRSTQWESAGSSVAHGALDLTINGRATSWSPMVQDERGCDSTTHTYTTVVKPRYDGALRFAIRDDKRSDNSGSLHVVARPLDAAASND